MPHDIAFLPMIDHLEATIVDCDAATRELCRAQLSLLVTQLERAGQQVPARLMELEALLTDAALEDQFDNMPV